MFLSLWTFCPFGRFVPLDVLSPRTFCPAGRFVPADILSLRTLCLQLFCLQTFCLRTFCPYGRFVLGTAPNRAL
jgi:hypothetical protein